MGSWKLKDLFWITTGDDEDEPPAPRDAAAKKGTREAPEVRRALQLLRDVSGVLGSIAVTNDGDLCGSDLPRAFDASALEALGMRMSQLRAALASADRPMKTATFRYQGHSLFVSQLDFGLVGILAEQQTNAPALDMVTRLVGQRLNATVPRR
jgi:predicted regulator of Ras-like GTPase activity (Roadblock/LC7/MglB family)